MWDYLLPFCLLHNHHSIPPIVLYPWLTLMYCVKIEKVLRMSKVWNNCLACHRGCAWFKYFVWWRWSIARLYDFVGITFFSLVILRRHNCFVSMLEVLLFSMSIWTFDLNLLDLNIHTTIKKKYIEIMPSSTPHQKFSFYHLPTRGRAGIKLGDAWYVSNVSIIFDCSMLYYLLLWTILDFIFHFYIIFGTNLLTGGPAQNCCFLPISVFRINGISNGVQKE